MQSRFGSPFDDSRYHAVVGMLTAKGLLYAPHVQPRKSGRLQMKDVLWVAENAEPRVFEVLPAAMLHFPRFFIGSDKLPMDLQEVIAALKRGETQHPPCRGIPFEKIKFWADKKLPDRRMKPLSQRKVLRSFRLAPDVIRELKRQAALRKTSASEYLEMLVRSGMKEEDSEKN